MLDTSKCFTRPNIRHVQMLDTYSSLDSIYYSPLLQFPATGHDHLQAATNFTRACGPHCKCFTCVALIRINSRSCRWLASSCRLPWWNCQLTAQGLARFPVFVAMEQSFPWSAEL